MRRCLPILLAAALLSGCGNDRTAAPELTRVPAPAGFTDARFAAQGVFVRVPTSWKVVPGDDPLVATVAGGDASVGIWRYERSEPLPRTDAELKAARKQLVEAVKSRDAGFDVVSTRIVRKPGLRGVEILGTGTNQGARRRVRSLHAYARGAEVVVDAFAPPDVFDRVDEQVFAALARSLRISEPRPSGSGG